MPKRTVEKWFLPNGNFPSWFVHYLELLEENNLQKAKIKVLELELKKGGKLNGCDDLMGYANLIIEKIVTHLELNESEKYYIKQLTSNQINKIQN